MYYPNNLFKRLELTGADHTSYYVEYTYDEAGNRKTVVDSGNRIAYNLFDGTYRPDPLNRTLSVDRLFDGATYRTEYRYDHPTLLTAVKYPESQFWLEYVYNSQHQIAEVVGFTSTQGIVYDQNGALIGIGYRNGVEASYGYDQNRRLKELQVAAGGQTLFGQDYRYDAASNITEIIDKLTNQVKTYQYDQKNQLTMATTPGTFLESEATPGNVGYRAGDYLGTAALDFGVSPQAVVSLDYHSSSIGLDFGTTAPGVKKIVLTPDTAHSTHRIEAYTLDLYVSADNLLYMPVPREGWEFVKEDDGTVVITLKERMATRYLKIHVLFDDRDQDFNPVNK